MHVKNLIVLGGEARVGVRKLSVDVLIEMFEVLMFSLSSSGMLVRRDLFDLR